MRERIGQIFQSIPPEGVAIHGTNLARAKRIQEEGFNPFKNPETPRPTWYIHQPLVEKPENHHVGLMYAHGEQALKHARKAATNFAYRLRDGGTDNEIPAVVVFKPNKNSESKMTTLTADFDIVQPENIIGIVKVFKDPTPHERNLVYLRILRLLARRKVINFGGLQQPRTK